MFGRTGWARVRLRDECPTARPGVSFYGWQPVAYLATDGTPANQEDGAA